MNSKIYTTRVDENADKKIEDIDEEESLPESVEIDFFDLDHIAGYVVDYGDGEDLAKWVRRYLRKTYKHCLARGVELDIEPDLEEDDLVRVSGIEWGRPLTERELENLDY